METPEISAEDRIRQLALICELDRLHLKIVLKPAPEHEVVIAGLPALAIGRALSFTQYFPGRIGQLARSMALGSAVFRIVKPFLNLRSKTNNNDTRHESNG